MQKITGDTFCKSQTCCKNIPRDNNAFGIWRN